MMINFYLPLKDLILISARYLVDGDSDCGNDVECINNCSYGLTDIGCRDDDNVGFYIEIISNGCTDWFHWEDEYAWCNDFIDLDNEPDENDLQMIVSFDTDEYDDVCSRGRFFAEKLADGWRVKQVGCYACRQSEGPGTYAAIAEACNSNTSNDNESIWLFGYVVPDPIPIKWWWWTNWV